MANMQVSVVSADNEVWSGEASQVIAKTVEGEIGVLAGHEPLLAILAEGEVRITKADGKLLKVDAEGGFFSVNKNAIEVVASRASLVA
ncbi:MAG TPA: F0F1 ATP synthase subunit epsilon [Microbacteriaceae bacterium]|nr:F0F1 ATP synthase subunit epsilon [Microbacteriaceae bacterium]